MVNSRPRITPKRGRLLACDVGDDFLGGGLQREVARVAVLEAQQLVAHLVPAPGLVPKFGGLHHRHDQLHGAGAVHLLPNDGFHLADRAQSHRHVAVDAGGDLADHAGAQHQLLADDFGIGRGFLEGEQMELAGAHGSLRIRREQARDSIAWGRRASVR
jgi:hypothetical protein